MTDSVILPPVVETNTNFATLLGTIDIGADAKSILLAMLNRASVKQFTFDDFGFSDPTRPIEDAPVRNTLIRLLPKSLTNLYGSTAIYYNRMHISVLGDISIFKNGASLISEVIPYINSTYGIYLSPTDYIDGPLPVANGNDQVSVNLTISPTCIQFYGGTKIVLALPDNIQVDKAHVGLSNVDNTADLSKPVSAAQAQANTDTLLAANVYTDSATAAAIQHVTLAIAASAQTLTDKEAADIVAVKAFASALVDSSAATILSAANNSVAAAIATINLPDSSYDPALILTQAASLASAKDNVVLTTAKTQWEQDDAVVLTSAKDDATAKDVVVLQSAKDFTTTSLSGVLASADTSAATKDAIVLSSAKTYADGKLTEANAYADTVVAGNQADISAPILVAAASAADTKDAVVLTSAEAFATSADATLRTTIATDWGVADAAVTADAAVKVAAGVLLAKSYSDDNLSAAVTSLTASTTASVNSKVATALQTAKDFATAADAAISSSAESFATAGDVATLSAAESAAAAADTALAATLAPKVHTHVASDISDIGTVISANNTSVLNNANTYTDGKIVEAKTYADSAVTVSTAAAVTADAVVTTNANAFATAAVATSLVTAHADAVTLDTALAATLAPKVHTHVMADVTDLAPALATKQASLQSGVSIKSVNGTSLLAGGDLIIAPVPAGGTTGQVLTKSSNVDTDATWVTPSAASQLTYIQTTRPVADGPWVWYQKDSNGNIIDFTINDGT